LAAYARSLPEELRVAASSLTLTVRKPCLYEFPAVRSGRAAASTPSSPAVRRRMFVPTVGADGLNSNRRADVWDFPCRLKTTVPVPHFLGDLAPLDVVAKTVEYLSPGISCGRGCWGSRRAGARSNSSRQRGLCRRCGGTPPGETRSPVPLSG
jgi:hypothetical protein